MADRASYSASKFALDGMTLALALEHAADSIIANSIAPGFIDTDLTQSMLGHSGIKALVAKVPVNRLGRDNEIARLTLWLSSDENTFIVGQNIAIDGGFTRA
jgi:3-oxoacyl-[acyl-carrier protein] reductase